MERRAVDILERDEIDAVDRINLVNRDDVRVIEGRGRFGFADEPPRAVRVAGRVRPKHLERDHPIQAGIERAVDHAHAAAPERREDAVVTEQPSDHGGTQSSTADSPATR